MRGLVEELARVGNAKEEVERRRGQERAEYERLLADMKEQQRLLLREKKDILNP